MCRLKSESELAYFKIPAVFCCLKLKVSGASRSKPLNLRRGRQLYLQFEDALATQQDPISTTATKSENLWHLYIEILVTCLSSRSIQLIDPVFGGDFYVVNYHKH